jgi:hypothetical protein
VDEFFEPARAKALRVEIQNRSASDREKIILGAVTSSITEARAIPLFFRFKSDQGRTSHHLVYASKNQRAAGMMKSILRSASPEIKEGAGSGEHNPRARESSVSMFAGMYEVEERLLSVYIGREIRFGALPEEEAHTRYPENNYRDAILKLEGEGRVVVDPPAENRRFQAGGEKRTLPKGVLVRFVAKAEHGN